MDQWSQFTPVQQDPWAGFQQVPQPKSIDQLDPTGEIRKRIAARNAAMPQSSFIQALAETAPETLKNVGRATGQGLTFGFGDEAEALARSKINGTKYEDELKNIRDEMAQYKAEHPAIAGSAELFGSLVPGVGLAGETVKGASLATKALKGAASAGAQSAVYGAGSSEGDIENRLKGAAAGGLIGTATGGIFPVVGEVGEAALEGLKKIPNATLGQSLGIAKGDTGVIGQTGRTVRGVESLLEKVPVVGTALVKGKKEAQAAGAKELIEGMTPEATVGKEGFGKQTEDITQQGLKSIKDDIHNAFHAELYNKLPQGQQTIATAPDSIQYVQNNLKRLSEKQQKWVQDNIIGEITDPNLSIERIKGMKGTVGNAAFNDPVKVMNDNVGQDFLHKFYDVVKNDEKNSVINAVPEEQKSDILKAWENSNNKYSEFKKSGVGEALEDLTDVSSSTKLGSKLINAVDAGNKGNMTLLNMLEDKLPPEAMTKIKQSIIRNRLLPEGTEPSAKSVENSLEKMSEEGKNFLFGADKDKIDALKYQMKTLGALKLTPEAEKTAVGTELLKLGGGGLALTMGGTSQNESIQKGTKTAAEYGSPVAAAAALGVLNPKLAAKILSSSPAVTSAITPFIASKIANEGQQTQQQVPDDVAQRLALMNALAARSAGLPSTPTQSDMDRLALEQALRRRK